MDMKVNIAGVEWKNPVTVASGTCGSEPSWSGNDKGRGKCPVAG